MKPCAHCGKPIPPTPTTRRYCSRECQGRARYRRRHPGCRSYNKTPDCMEQPPTRGAFNCQSFQQAPVEKIIRQFQSRGYQCQN